MKTSINYKTGIKDKNLKTFIHLNQEKTRSKLHIICIRIPVVVQHKYYNIFMLQFFLGILTSINTNAGLIDLHVVCSINSDENQII